MSVIVPNYKKISNLLKNCCLNSDNPWYLILDDTWSL